MNVFNQGKKLLIWRGDASKTRAETNHPAKQNVATGITKKDKRKV
jgi:hypothetical protein